MIAFTVPGDPVPAPRPRVTRSGGVFTPPKYEAYRDEVAWEYRRAQGRNGRPIEGGVIVHATFFLRTRRRTDLDNLAKTILDALNGLAYKDDSQVCALAVRKLYDPDHPRVNVRVKAA
jgi:crossover junction endodeoxyribonuclease RusA